MIAAVVIVEGAEEAVDGSRLKELLSVLSQETVRLVLTRNKSQVSTAKPFNVEAELEREEAFALLREFWQEGRDETVIVLIYHRFGGHPLALTWAGSQLNAAEESPNAFVQALNATTLPAITEPGYVERQAAGGSEITPTSPEEMRKIQIAEIALYREMMKIAGIEPE